MKKRYFLLLLTISLGFAQPSATYYNTASGTGYALKTQLKNIITAGHSDQGYASLWTLYSHTSFRDNYYENNGSLLDLYSENPTGPDSYEYSSTTQQCGNYNSEGDCYNREHLVPQSYFDNFQVNPMKNDPFHVVPSDGKVNGDRNNLPFGLVTTPNYTSTNGSKRGTSVVNSATLSNFNGTVFEPIDAFKGDVARSFFYFATRYEDFMDNFYTAANSTTCQAKSMFDGSTNKVFSDEFINLLIKWHLQDPVSAKEIAQNNRIFTYQGNRNPYIDNPNYVCQIWTTQCNFVTTSLSNNDFDLNSEVLIYPNPSNENYINIQSKISFDEIQVTNVNGQIIRDFKNPIFNNENYIIDNLPKGFYLIRLTVENQSLTKKIILQ
jgi:endonuclease I